jgi:hypothetical protein
VHLYSGSISAFKCITTHAQSQPPSASEWQHVHSVLKCPSPHGIQRDYVRIGSFRSRRSVR